jgi:hypothetical protein
MTAPRVPLRRAASIALTLCGIGLLSGCATVEPWQRGYLARSDMQFAGGNPALTKARDKTFTAKESASGGTGVGGGGCGCN